MFIKRGNVEILNIIQSEKLTDDQQKSIQTAKAAKDVANSKKDNQKLDKQVKSENN